MAAKGFKIADGYVEIRAEINESQIRNAARRVGREFGTSGGGEGGRTFSSAMAASIVRNLEKDFDIKVVRSRLIPGLGSTIQQSLRKSIADGGEESGRGFFDRFARGLLKPNPRILSALRTGVPALLSSPLGVAALTLGTTFAASFVTAFISSGVLGVIGSGLLGLGALAVVASGRVKDAFTDTSEQIKRSFASTAGALVPEFAAAVDSIGHYFETGLAPRLRSIFSDLSPVVRSITVSVIETVDRLAAALQPHARDLADLLDHIFGALPSISDAVGDFFDKLMSDRGAIQEGFDNIVRVVNGLLRFSGDFLVTGTKIFNFLSDLDAWLRGSFLWKVLAGEVSGIFSLLELIGRGVDAIFPDPLNVEMERLQNNLTTFGQTGRAAGEVFRLLGKNLEKLKFDLQVLGPKGFFADFDRTFHNILETVIPPLGNLEYSQRRVEERMRALDQALAQLVSSGNAKAASQAFDRIAKVAGSVGVNVDRLKELFPLYTAAIEAAVAPTSELVIKANNWADALQGTIDVSTASGAAFEAFRQRTDLLSSSMAEAVTEAGNLKNALDILNGGALAVRAAERQLEQAIDAATESIKENGRTLDINTQAGRNNQAALDAIAVSAQVLASAIYDHTAATDGFTAAQDAAVEALQRGREALINAAIEAGKTREEAKKLADQILGIPEQWVTEFEARTEKAKRNIDELIRKINGIKDKTVTLTVQHINRFLQSEFGAGANLINRFGGVHYAQHGLISLGPTATVFPAGRRPLFGFAEPGTGGEAFIARNAPRDRSLSILDVAARWHKAIVVPMERVAERATHAGPRELLVQIPIQIGDEVVRVVDARIDLHDSKLNDLLIMRTGAAR